MSERASDATGASLAVFVAERPRLVGLAYRMLASRTDAEDVVQEAWLRWQAADGRTIERPAAWLTTVVSRLALDRLRARQRDRADYVGPWLPEPAVIADNDPSIAVERRDSLRFGYLHLLERLSARERVALVLADVFDEPHETISTVLDETVVNSRQLVSRARRKLGAPSSRGGATTRDAAARVAATAFPQRAVRSPKAAIDAMLDAFVAAAATGDRDALLTVLAPDVVLVTDGGATQHAARRPVCGQVHVAQAMTATARHITPGTRVERITVNDEPMLVLRAEGRVTMVIAVDGHDGVIDTVLVVVNPDKLRRVGEPLIAV